MSDETSPPSETRRAPRDALHALGLLVLLSVAYGVFLWLYVPRMNNYVMSDREFTGWVGPIAERLLRGDRPYVDFVLPIPPGSFVVLAAIQKLAGRPLVLQELWVAAISHFLMGFMAYAMATRFTTRRTAVLVATATLVIVTQSPKECVYDHTSQLFAWASLTTGVYALFSSGKLRRFLWLLAGVLASSTLVFKQSTAVGIVLGYALAVPYLVWIEWRSLGREEGLRRVVDGAFCFAGGILGLVVVWATLHSLGSTVDAFVQSVFRDGPELKGGRLVILRNLFNYVFRHDAVRNSMVPTALMLALGVALARRGPTLHLGDEPERRASLGGKRTALLALGIVATFGVAIGLLAGEIRMLDRNFTANVDTWRNFPAFGFGFATVFFAAHLIPEQTEAKTAEERRRGHAFNAFIIIAMTSSMLYNTSFIHFSPFYYNNPSIPLALLFLFIASERARLPWVTALLFVICVIPLYGIKLNRALGADISVHTGQWAGMRVNYRGRELLKAADRIHQLASPDETVLVLPEDVQFTGLVQRPRPPVRGAILFVDQYPSRLLQHDLQAIDDNLPKVIVIHPRRRRDWHTLYNTWNEDSAAKRVLDHVLDDLLPKHYQRDSTFPTIYFWDQGQLDVYVRKNVHDDGNDEGDYDDSPEETP